MTIVFKGKNMSKTNARAIAKLLEAQKTLKKLGRSSDTSVGIAFASDLIRLLEKGKPCEIALGDERYGFKPCDVRVSRTRVQLGKINLNLGTLQSGTDEDYEVTMLVDEVNLLAETVPVRLAQAV